MTAPFRIFLAATCAFLLSTIPAGAATLIDFDFANGGADIDETIPYTGTSVFDSNLAPFGGGSVGLAIGAGLDVGATTADAFVFGDANDKWSDSLANAITDQSYVSFTLEPATGFAMDLASGTFAYKISGFGGSVADRPDSMTLLTSVEGFPAGAAVDTAAGMNASNPAAVTFNLPSSVTYDNLTSAVEFRLYFWDSDGTADTGRMRFDGSGTTSPDGFIQVSGDLFAVPEPSTTLFLIGSLGFLMATRRRRT